MRFFLQKAPFTRIISISSMTQFYQILGGSMEALLTVKDLTGILQVTEQTIQRYILAKEIPYCKIKRMVRFRPSEIEKWIDNGGLNKKLDENADSEADLFAEAADGEGQGTGAKTETVNEGAND